MLGAALVSQPGTEVLAAAACFGLIGAGPRTRRHRWRDRRQARARRSAFAATRYAAAAAVQRWQRARCFHPKAPTGFAQLAYAATVVATLALAASLLAPTRAGAFAIERTRWPARELLKTPASAEIFARTAEYAVAARSRLWFLAVLTPQLFAERFATAAYLAILFAGLGIAVKWRLERLSEQSAVPGTHAAREAKFVGAVALLLFVGPPCGFSLIAETLAACACLYADRLRIVKRAGAVDAK